MHYKILQKSSIFYNFAGSLKKSIKQKTYGKKLYVCNLNTFKQGLESELSLL